MPREPVAGGTLCRSDLRLRHFRRDLAAIADRLALSAHRGQVEPLMRGNEIRGHRASGRISDYELEQDVAGRICLTERLTFDFGELIASHAGLPCSCARCFEASRVPSSSSIPRPERGDHHPRDFKDGLKGAMNE